MRRQAIQLTAEGAIRPLQPGASSPHGYKRVVFLVHGFNNDASEAGSSYSTMRRELDATLRHGACPEPRRRTIQELMWEFHWPGYFEFRSTMTTGRRRTRREQGISAAEYFVQVGKARGWVADAFAAYCLRLGATEIAFIAHSLGCRLVLETINRIMAATTRTTQVSGALLMAGAVPVQFLLPGGRFRAATAFTSSRYCFYSRRDMVLALAFPGGQALAGEVAPFAIGQSGWPRSAWSRHRNTTWGHGDYWSRAFHAPVAADIALSEVIAGLFLMRVGRTLPASQLFAGEAVEEAFLPAWRIAERRLTGADWLDDICGNE